MKKFIVPLVSAVVVVSIMFSGCVGAPAPEEPTTKPVKIGVISIRTGVAKIEGDEIVDGINFAVKEIEEGGGILGGRPIEVKIYDEGYTSEVAIAAAKEAVADGCSGLVAFTNATTGEAAVSILKPYEIPVCVPATGSYKIAKDGYYGVVHFMFYVILEKAAIASWVEEQGLHRGIQVAFDAAYSRYSEAYLRDRWDRPDSPFELLPSIYLPHGQETAPLEITKAVGQNPDVIFLDLWGSKLVESSLMQLHELDYTGAKIFAMTCLHAPEIEEVPEAAEGSLCTYGWMRDPKVPESMEWADRFLAEYGHEPGALHCHAYEAAKTLLLAMDKAGTDSDLEKIADAIHNDVNFVSPRGERMAFIQRRSGGAEVLWSRIFLGQAQDGELVALDFVPLTVEDYDEDLLPPD